MLKWLDPFLAKEGLYIYGKRICVWIIKEKKRMGECDVRFRGT